MKNLLIIFCCVLSLCSMPANADIKKQDHAAISKVVMAFLQAKTQGMPGKISLDVEELDPRVTLAPCSKLEAFMPVGASLMGKTSVGVRCDEKDGWSLYIQVSVTSTMNMLVSSKPLQHDQVITAADFSVQSGELTQPGIVTDAAQILGKVIKYSIGAGQLLKMDMFRAPYVVNQGQTVQLVSVGRGFVLRAEGKAMNNAAAGQPAQVKVPSGKIISGIAKDDGSVEVQ